MGRIRHPVRATALAAAVSLLVTPAARAVASSAAGASVRLVRSQASIDVVRRTHHRIGLDLGIWVEAVGGNLEVQAARAGYDSPITLDLRDADGSFVPLPAGTNDGWYGLRRFTDVTVRDANGEVVARSKETMCPAAWDRNRVDDAGPMNPVFPSYGCFANPFTLGAVWGIERDWAVPAVAWSPGSGRVRLPDGSYTVRFSVDPSWRSLLRVGHDQAATTVDLTVTTDPNCHPCNAARSPAPPTTVGSVAPDATAGRHDGVPIDTTPAPGTLPDLMPLPSADMWVRSRHHHDALTFGATVWNRGPAPMVVEGFREPDSDVMDAFQYFFRKGVVVGKAPVGSLAFDPRRGHEHWHFEQFARYTLLGADHQRIVRSRKEAFCLAPTDPIDLLAKGAEWFPRQIGFALNCGSRDSLWVRETLEAGWGDTYYQYLPGQSFDITNLPNGRYYVEIQANPRGLLYERGGTNDVSYRRIRLRGTPGHRRVVVPAWHGLDGP